MIGRILLPAFIFLLISTSCQKGDEYLYVSQPSAEKQCWDEHNLAVLSGCWKLGQERMETCYVNDNQPVPCKLSAWSVCFDDKGNSTSSLVTYSMQGTDYNCAPPFTAHFNNANQLVIANHTIVRCNGNFNDNAQDSFTCNYQSDGRSSCVYQKGGPDPDNGSTTILQRVIDSSKGPATPGLCE